MTELLLERPQQELITEAVLAADPEQQAETFDALVADIESAVPDDLKADLQKDEWRKTGIGTDYDGKCRVR